MSTRENIRLIARTPFRHTVQHTCKRSPQSSTKDVTSLTSVLNASPAIIRNAGILNLLKSYVHLLVRV